jgi:L-lactate dehydrogenase complex protein LldG
MEGAEPMSTMRDTILGRVKEALSRPSNPGVRSVAGDGVRDVREARSFLPPGGETDEERMANFTRLAEKLKVEVHLAKGQLDVGHLLKKLKEEENWDRIASHRTPVTESQVPGLGLPVVWTDDEPDTDTLEACPVGITRCEALIAQTGSVLITSKGCGGRALSVLPPHHIVLAKRSQLLPDMLAGYDLLRETYGSKMPSFISFITGASRTGDIERILVLGAHGPKRLTVIISD